MELCAGPLLVAGAVLLWQERAERWNSFMWELEPGDSTTDMMVRAMDHAAGVVLALSGAACASTLRDDAGRWAAWARSLAAASVLVGGLAFCAGSLASRWFLILWGGGSRPLFSDTERAIESICEAAGGWAIPVAAVALGVAGVACAIAMLSRPGGAPPLVTSRAMQVAVWLPVAFAGAGSLMQVWACVDLWGSIGTDWMGVDLDPSIAFYEMLSFEHGLCLAGVALAAWSIAWCVVPVVLRRRAVGEELWRRSAA
ncbi:MAG: hypothetical protein GC159_19880 [Phycisphaera sp.]|nr:hypothetical protein [Phycisphaera sp.]